MSGEQQSASVRHEVHWPLMHAWFRQSRQVPQPGGVPPLLLPLLPLLPPLPLLLVPPSPPGVMPMGGGQLLPAWRTAVS
jgi:hypothetical protein